MMRIHRLGRDAETRAAEWLARAGLELIDRNYRCRQGEIDLIMRDAQTLVFVEVRYRRSTGFGGALASIDSGKQHRLIRAAQHYLANRPWSGPCRFDVVGLQGDTQPAWIRDAFSA